MTSFADPGGGGDTARTATVNLNANVSGYSQQMAQASAQTGGLASSVDQLQSKLHDLNKWAGRKLFQFAAADFAVLSGATADAAMFQKQLSTLAATAAVTGTSMKGLKGGVEDAFTSFGVSRGQVIALVEAITNLGVTAPAQISSLTTTFIKLGAATGEPMTQLAGGLIQLSRLMGSTDAGQVGNFANSLLTVSKNAGVSASGVLDFAQNIAPMARQAGIGEAAVLGISSAFSKVGADGRVGANTFNTILSDITTATATGSPELIKYANLLGITQDQFKKMDKTAGIVDIFKQLTKLGPQAVTILNSIGVEGVRGQAAVAAVMQGGGLEAAIAQAQGAQGNQGNLNKGSHAAMNNLADSLSRVRNEFTQFGTEIGTTFLAPMALVANVTANVGKSLNGLIRPLAPLLGGLAAVAGGVGAAGGLAVNAAGAIGAYALIQTLRRSQPVTAFKGGIGAGREQAAGRIPTDEATGRYTDPNVRMPFMQRAGYLGGVGLGGLRGSADLPPEGAPLIGTGSWATWRNMGLAAPFRLPSMAIRGSQRFLDESRLSARERWNRDFGKDRIPLGQSWRTFQRDMAGLTPSQVVQTEIPRLARTEGAYVGSQIGVGGQMARTAVSKGWELLGPRAVTGVVTGALTGMPVGAGTVVNRLRTMPGQSVGEAAGATSAAGTSFFRGMTYMAKEPALAMHILGATAKETAASVGRLGMAAGRVGLAQGANLGAQGLGKLMGGVGAVGGAAWRLGGGLLSTAMSPLGMAAIMGGVAGDKMYRKTQQESDLTQYLNPIQKYNDLLGTTTSNLATFSAALAGGAASINGGLTETLTQAMKVSDSVVKTAPNKPVVSAWSGIKGQDAALAMLGSMPVTDAKQLRAIQSDMAASGMSKQDIQGVMDRYSAGGGPSPTSGLMKNVNYGALGQNVVGTEGHGVNWNIHSANLFSGGGNYASQSKTGAKIAASALSGIDSQRLSDTANVNAGYANQQALISYSQFFAPEIGAASGSSHKADATREAIARQASKITGGGYGGYLSTLAKNAHGVDLKGGMTTEEEQKSFIKLLQSTKQGRSYLDKISPKDANGNPTGGNLDPAQFQTALLNLQNTSDGSDFNSMLRSSGQLGQFAAGNKTIQSAIGSGSGNFVTTQKATALLGQQASKLNFGNTGGAMGTLATQMTYIDPSSPLYKQLSAAQQNTLQEQQYAAPFQSRAQNFATSTGNYQAASRSYNKSMSEGTATTDQYAFMQARKGEYEQSLASNMDYNKQMYLQAQSFGLQMTRAAEDNSLNVKHAQQDFQLQMLHGQQDYLKQRKYTQEDFDRQLANQAATAAQAIYDPYQRVQAKYTMDSGTLLTNLTDQNRRIKEQQDNLGKVSKMGLSTQAIQTLGLSDPNNAQQLDNLMQSLANDPRLIAQINKQAATRVKGAASLTQSSYNLQFVQSQKDFQIQLGRTKDAYDISVQRANESQDIAMNRMADAYAKTTKRAGDDMAIAMTEVTGTFSSLNTKAMAAIANSVEKFSPAAAAVMRKDLTSLADEFPGLGLKPAKMSDKGGKTYNSGMPTGPQGSSAAPAPKPAPGGAKKTAFGGIATAPQERWVAEAGSAEAMIPLNDRGQQFMAGLIARALSQGVTQAYTSAPAQSSSTMIDQSTSYSGAQITVQADDPNRMARELKAKEKLKRLASPVRH